MKLGEMADEFETMEVHPAGDRHMVWNGQEMEGLVDTYGGRFRVEWDRSAKVTAFGPLSYFIHFLKTSGLWEEWVEFCPLRFTSNNAPSKEKIPGTILLLILAGHKRYAHITTVRSDKVLPELLGMDGIASEDSVRRAFLQASDEELTLWLDRSMNTVFDPLLSEPWVLDVDATVKTLYGKQEQARVGYNPMKPGRPSHVYHAYCIARLRMVLNADVHAGNQTGSEYAHPGLWGWLDARPREQWPEMLRGDVAWGTEKTMCEAEARQLPYLFKLRQSEGVVRHLVEISRRPLPVENVTAETETATGQPVLTGMVVVPKDRGCSSTQCW